MHMNRREQQKLFYDILVYYWLIVVCFCFLTDFWLDMIRFSLIGAIQLFFVMIILLDSYLKPETIEDFYLWCIYSWSLDVFVIFLADTTNSQLGCDLALIQILHFTIIIMVSPILRIQPKHVSVTQNMLNDVIMDDF